MKGVLLAAAVLVCAISGSAAHAEWPDHPIHWVVPFGPGGANDLIARVAAEAASKKLGQQMLHLLTRAGFDAQTEVRRIAVRASDIERFDFETAVRLDYLIEDLLRDVGIDQVAFGLDNFLKCHDVPV